MKDLCRVNTYSTLFLSEPICYLRSLRLSQCWQEEKDYSKKLETDTTLSTVWSTRYNENHFQKI
jgi:hypothetical protein